MLKNFLIGLTDQVICPYGEIIFPKIAQLTVSGTQLVKVIWYATADLSSPTFTLIDASHHLCGVKN